MAQESIEALLNPSLKVSRPVAACAKCRSAKIKCIFDGKSLACSACERVGKGKECSSAIDEFARGKERSYTSALETAIQRLQRKIDEVKLSDHRDDPLYAPYGRPSLQRRPISSTQRREAGSVDELVSDFGFLTVNATSRDFSGFSSTMSFAKLLNSIALKRSLPVTHDSGLPSRSTISHLIEHYFENVHVMLPFLSETEFLISVTRIYQEGPTVSVVSPFDMWCFHTVLAISSAALCHSRGDENYNNAMYNISAAMNISEHVLQPGSIPGVQALLLLVQYSLVDPEHFDSWYLIGMASRLIVDLGLHCEPAVETKVSKHVLDLRRRLFYCTFALDRLISMSLGLAFSFTDDSAPNVLLPTLATDQEGRSPTQLFQRSVRPSLFLFDIRRVQSAFYQKTRWSSRDVWATDAANNYVSSTLDDIRAWQSTLPQSFSERHRGLFYLESLYSQALTMSPNQVMPMATVSDVHKLMFFDCAVQYSERFCAMVQNSELRSSLSYLDCCRARYVSRQFQNIMWASFDLIMKSDPSPSSPIYEHGPLNNCTRALQFLDNMSQILDWPIQRWGISALQEIFAQESAVLLGRLRSRQQAFGMIHSPSAATSPTGQQYGVSNSITGPSFQHVIIPQLPPVSQLEMPSMQRYDSDFQAPPNFSFESLPPHSNSTMHRASLLNTSSWSPNADQSNSDLPQGSLPRRSYQFTGSYG